MGLNIVATRKMSLKGFGEGWDDCYLIIRSANEVKRKEWHERLLSDQSDEMAVEVTRQACLDSIVGGMIMNTDESGKAQATKFDAADVPDVVAALNFSWQQEAMSIATGADRLKAMTM